MRDLFELLKLVTPMQEACHPREAVPYGMHKHQCPTCGNTWKHSDIVPMLYDEAGNREAHSCKLCGTVNYWKL